MISLSIDNQLMKDLNHIYTTPFVIYCDIIIDKSHLQSRGGAYIGHVHLRILPNTVYFSELMRVLMVGTLDSYRIGAGH